ncbi:MAG: glutathione S-transferase [Paraglaciecola sp.]|jgi:glutathione S-transferase
MIESNKIDPEEAVPEKEGSQRDYSPAAGPRQAAPHLLYGAPLSLYTGKARSYLTFKQIPFEEVFSSLSVYKKIIVPKTGVRFIPVVKTPQDEFLQDTSSIIDTLEQRHPHRPIIPATPKQKLLSYLFELWADEWLLIPAMHYRWNKDNFPFIYEEFGKIIAPRMPAFIRAFLGKRIGARFKGFVPLLGITDKSIPAIEDWYENHVLLHLEQHFSEHDYLLGGAPTLGDFALMGPLYAHLYRDPAPGALMRSKAPHVARWVERMNQAQSQVGELLAEDQIPETLIPIMRRMFKELWPVLVSTVSALGKWTEDNKGQHKIPRTVGNHSFTIGDVTEQRAIITFHQWKLQRVLDCYQSFDVSQKEQVDFFLQDVQGIEAMQQKIGIRLKRENNKLMLC